MIMFAAVFHPMFSNVNNTVPCLDTVDCDTPLSTHDNDDVAVFHPASPSLSFAMSGVSESKCHDMEQCCLHLKTLGEKQQQHYHLG